MAVVKPGEARRQEGNMSAPVDQSFNEGILEGSLKEWKGVQAASKQVANMIARSGRNSGLTCSNMPTSRYEAKKMASFQLFG